MNIFKTPETMNVHDLIQKEFDIDLPIGKGAGLSVDDPIVMKADHNFVHNEYQVIEYLASYRLIKWQFVSQALIRIGDRKYDLIKISLNNLVDSKNWTEVIYFDVSDCLGINADTMVEME